MRSKVSYWLGGVAYLIASFPYHFPTCNLIRSLLGEKANVFSVQAVPIILWVSCIVLLLLLRTDRLRKKEAKEGTKEGTLLTY